MTQQLQETKPPVVLKTTLTQQLAAAVVTLVVLIAIIVITAMVSYSAGRNDGLKQATTGSSVTVTTTVLSVDDGVTFSGNSTIKAGDPLGVSLTPSDVVKLSTKGTICRHGLAISTALTQQTHAVSCGQPVIHVVLVAPIG